MGELAITILKYVVYILLPLGVVCFWYYKGKGRIAGIENLIYAIAFLLASLVYIYSYVFEKLITPQIVDSSFHVHYLSDTRFGFLAYLFAASCLSICIYFAGEFARKLKNKREYDKWFLSKERKYLFNVLAGVFFSIIIVVLILMNMHYTMSFLDKLSNMMTILMIALSWQAPGVKSSKIILFQGTLGVLALASIILFIYPENNIYEIIRNYTVNSVYFVISLALGLQIIDSKKEEKSAKK